MVQTANLGEAIRVDILSTHADRVPPTPAVKEPDSYIKWGASSQFDYDDSFRDYAVSVEDVTPSFPFQGEWVEEGRKWTDFKVENPEDKDQYVIVQKLEAVAFSGPAHGTHRLNQNPHPQVIMSFKNDNDGTKYRNSQGEEFEPICLDPFHTIIKAVWKKGDFAILSIMVGPNGSGSLILKVTDPTDIFLGTDNPTYENGGEELFKNGANGAMSDPDVPDIFHHNEKASTPVLSQTDPVPWRVSPDGMTSWNWSLTELSKNTPNGDWAHMQIRYHSSGFTMFWVGDNNGSGPQYLQNEIMMDNFAIPSVGANGTVRGATSDGGGSQWRLVGSGPGGVGHIYQLFDMAWNERYDDEPYAYNMAMVKNDKLLKALFTLMQAQQTPSITIDVITDGFSHHPGPGDEKSYHGPGKMRVSWYRGNKNTLEAADKLLAMSFTTGGGGPIVIDPGGGGAPQQLYLTPTEMWEALRFGVGYIEAGASATLAGALVTEQEYTFPSGAGVDGQRQTRKHMDVNFQTKTYDAQ